MPDHYQVAFDVVRVASFTAILLGHIMLMLGGRFPVDGQVHQLFGSIYGYTRIGTMTFFALASFYLCRTLLLGESAKPALLRRVQRIYPPYALMTLAYTAVLLVLPWGDKFPTGAWARATYVLSNLLMLPSITAGPTILAVGWAVGSVVYAYFAIALGFGVLGMRQWRRGWRVGLWLAVGAGLEWLGLSGASQQYGLDFFRLSGFAMGAIGAELWMPLGTWRAIPGDASLSVRCVRLLRTISEFVLGDWFRRLMGQGWVRNGSRFGARWAYHTLLTQGIALHSLRLAYPFGNSSGAADLACIIVLALLISHGLGWVLAECEQRLYRTATVAWHRLRTQPMSPEPLPAFSE